jgi:hypothetical protein
MLVNFIVLLIIPWLRLKKKQALLNLHKGDLNFVDSSCGFEKNMFLLDKKPESFEGCLPDSPAYVFLDSVVGAVTDIQLSIIRDISALYTAAPQTTQVCITLTLIYMVKISVYAAVYPSVYSEANFKYTLWVMAL